jgi:hypothetical protein
MGRARGGQPGNTKGQRTAADDLKVHALNAIACRLAEGLVIKKERVAGKIDAFIALGMAMTAGSPKVS